MGQGIKIQCRHILMKCYKTSIVMFRMDYPLKKLNIQTVLPYNVEYQSEMECRTGCRTERRSECRIVLRSRNENETGTKREQDNRNVERNVDRNVDVESFCEVEMRN
jgi:hypothetical protein